MNRPTITGAVVGLGSLLAPFVAHATEPTDLFTRSLSTHGWLAALPAAFLGGLLTAGTGCVYPMIGITVSVFGARSESRRRAMMLASAFVQGIAMFFVPLGLLAGLSGSVAGALAGHPVVILVEAALMFAMALSMFGVFDISLPSSVQGRLAAIGGRGLKGAFLIGLVLGPIAAPCATAPLAGILDFIFRSKNAPLGAAALYAYSLGLGLPFWLVASFGMALPKGGRWMHVVKGVLGAVLMVMGAYYLRRLVPALASPPAWIPGAPWSLLALVALGLAAGAVHLSFKDGSAFQKIRQGLAVLLVTIGAVWTIGYEPNRATGGACAPITWQSDLAGARATAVREGRPMILDFGATWCPSCEELAHRTFVDPHVACTASELRFVPVKIYDDVDRPANYAELQRQFDVRALPTVIVLDARGREVAREREFVDATRMVALLRRVEARSSLAQ